MSQAPEKISIKRRRLDEPVDHLLYQSKKQRTSNHVFVRLRPEGNDQAAPLSAKSVPLQQTEIKHLPAVPSGIPIVKATRPGDEVKDFREYEAAKKARTRPLSSIENVVRPSPLHTIKPPNTARRFHLTRDLSTALRPEPSGGIRKHKSSVRPHLPTFIERLAAAEKDDSFHLKAPVDRIIKSSKPDGLDVQPHQIMSDSNGIKKSNIQPFQKPRNSITRNGRSIRDDPATWDLDSDQLADELAALALEMDPSAKFADLADQIRKRDELLAATPFGLTRVNEPDDYVFETYIRLQPDAVMEIDVTSESKSFGYLVIDEEDEDLWEQYLREEDDGDEWDEEDADSNAEDNPRNEYPDEEVSSDDEYGVNIYKYRRNCSDDEQFDEDDQ